MRVKPHNRGTSKFKSGDTRSTRSGYTLVYAPEHPLAARRGSWIYEHRKIVYDSGFPLEPMDHVHHINRNKADNKLANLRVLNASIHQRTHGLERGGWQTPVQRLATIVAWARAVLKAHGDRFPE